MYSDIFSQVTVLPPGMDPAPMDLTGAFRAEENMGPAPTEAMEVCRAEVSVNDQESTKVQPNHQRFWSGSDLKACK